MPKPVFLLLLFCFQVTCLSAQTLITEMGNVKFYNTLDSAKSAWITNIARRCFCLLDITDTTHTLHLKLDIDQVTDSADTSFYRLDYDVLAGNFNPATDSSAGADNSETEQPGIYIRVRDSVIRGETILTLVDYGIRHYTELKRSRQTGPVYDKAFINHLMTQKQSLKLKRAIAFCK